jgi:hypothetical protein
LIIPEKIHTTTIEEILVVRMGKGRWGFGWVGRKKLLCCDVGMDLLRGCRGVISKKGDFKKNSKIG